MLLVGVSDRLLISPSHIACDLLPHMEDPVHVESDREAAFRAKSFRSSPRLAVTFNKESETCAIVEVSERAREEGMEDAMGGEDSDIKDDPEAVLLQQDMKKSQMRILFPSVYTFFSSYRSSSPDERVTPFAIVLLIVLFLIYVLNQADRLVLAVTIPAGLRCELKASECKVNGSTNNSLLSTFGDHGVHPAGNDVTMIDFLEDYNANTTNETKDCIHFSDSEQGLLTGTCGCNCRRVILNVVFTLALIC